MLREGFDCCSGPGQVMELELKVDSSSMKQLLQFLSGGFNGGTDVDKPLELSLKRLSEKEWNQVLINVTVGLSWGSVFVLLEGTAAAVGNLTKLYQMSDSKHCYLFHTKLAIGNVHTNLSPTSVHV